MTAENLSNETVLNNSEVTTVEPTTTEEYVANNESDDFDMVDDENDFANEVL